MLDWSPSAAAASAIGKDAWLSAQDGLSVGRPPCCLMGVCPLMSAPPTCFRIVDVCRAHVNLWFLLDTCGKAQTQGHVTVIPDAVSSARDAEVLAGLGNILMARVSRAWSCYRLLLLTCCSNTSGTSESHGSSGRALARGSNLGTLIAV